MLERYPGFQFLLAIDCQVANPEGLGLGWKTIPPVYNELFLATPPLHIFTYISIYIHCISYHKQYTHNSISSTSKHRSNYLRCVLRCIGLTFMSEQTIRHVHIRRPPAAWPAQIVRLLSPVSKCACTVRRYSCTYRLKHSKSKSSRLLALAFLLLTPLVYVEFRS